MLLCNNSVGDCVAKYIVFAFDGSSCCLAEAKHYAKYIEWKVISVFKKKVQERNTLRSWVVEEH